MNFQEPPPRYRRRTRHGASAAVEDIPFTVMSAEVSEGKSHEPGCPA
jgi:hypothetical protein